ncbi:MAG: hypothetical protein ACC661_11470, partial [Verrucomicrobiales bacterium]
PNPALTLPVVEQSHTEMRSVVGGLFYEGEALPGLAGKYLYACYFTRRLWAVSWDGKEAGTPERIASSKFAPVSFARDRRGEVYVVGYDGGILRLEKREEIPEFAPFPQALSETGLFASTGTGQPARGLVPYEINAQAWAGGARRERFFALSPRGGQITVQPRAPRIGVHRWRWPNGSALVQTFFLGKGRGRPVETQVLHKDEGEWRFLSYRWNEEGSDASLAADGGEEGLFEIATDKGSRYRAWRFLSRVECAACHTQRSFFGLGLNPEQMNRDFDYHAWGGGISNQLATLGALGLFDKPIARAGADLLTLPDPYGENGSLEGRARAYLHVNCATCHRETGLGGRAEFELLHWLSLEETGAGEARPLVGLPGGEDVRIIAPGHPERSEICRRMGASGPGRMPLLGPVRIDRRGLALIEQWVRSLK